MEKYESYGSYTLHGTGHGNGTRNNGFLYYAMHCTHYTETDNGTSLLCPIVLVSFHVPVLVPFPCSVTSPVSKD